VQPSTISQEAHAGTSRDCLESSDRPSSGPPTTVGIAAALMTAGWYLLDCLYQPPSPYGAAAAAVLGILVLAWPLMKPPRFRSGARVLAIGVLASLLLASVDRTLVSLEARTPTLGIFAQVVAPLLSGAGYPAAAEGGSLQVEHPDGLVTVLTSFEKVGARPFVALWCLWAVLLFALDRRRFIDVVTAGAVALLLIAIARFTACVIVYLEYDNILAGSGGYDALSLFSSPAVGAATIIASGVALDTIRRRLPANLPFVAPSALPVRLIVLSFGGSIAAGLLIGFAGSFDPPGREKPGRVLFDDRFCGVWEPTARLLDTEWYGDFSTYSFGSLAEWLGHWFSVDVNTQRPYTDGLLAQYDVLILKTPVQPIPEAEREAIDRFVTSGGGLLLVGDHTNLLGMGTHLNSLCAKYGVRFRYDSVSDAITGGFVDYFGPSIGRNVAAMRVDHLQFMTSCSLQLDSRAEPIITATSCRRDPHDYANSSFFGRLGPHPELAHGPTVLAASTRAGRGRIALFTDSTVWSSFAVFQYDREKLAADLVGLLNREGSPLVLPLRAAAIIALVLSIFAGVMWVRAGAAVPVFLGWLVGAWGGMLAADQLHRAVYDLGPPRSSIHEIVFLWQGGSCAFPPVLGGTGSLPLDRAFDTLFVSVQRLGLVPRVAYTYDRDLFTANTRALFVIAPVDHPPPSTLSRIEAFVRHGGSLIVLDDGRLGGAGSARDYMAAFGIDLQYAPRSGPKGEPLVHSSLSGLTEMRDVPAPGTFVGHRTHGTGHVVYMRDAADFSRVGMGHCFSRPGKLQRARYDTIFWLLRDVLHLAPSDRKYYGICE
jgi:hypothetical protein